MSDQRILANARELRKRMTDVEQFVWKKLRARRFAGFKFRRQVPIGEYVVDFVCFAEKIVVELDGGQHNEPPAKQYDAARLNWLESQCFRVLRVWNHEARENWDGFEEKLWMMLTGKDPASGKSLAADPNAAK